MNDFKPIACCQVTDAKVKKDGSVKVNGFLSCGMELRQVRALNAAHAILVDKVCVDEIKSSARVQHTFG